MVLVRRGRVRPAVEAVAPARLSQIHCLPAAAWRRAEGSGSLRGAAGIEPVLKHGSDAAGAAKGP
jgi:hypothetical protein